MKDGGGVVIGIIKVHHFSKIGKRAFLVMDYKYQPKKKNGIYNKFDYYFVFLKLEKYTICTLGWTSISLGYLC